MRVLVARLDRPRTNLKVEVEVKEVVEEMEEEGVVEEVEEEEVDEVVEVEEVKVEEVEAHRRMVTALLTR